MELIDRVTPIRRDRGNHRHRARQTIKVVQREIESELSGKGQEVEHRVCRPTNGQVRFDRIGDRPVADDIADRDALLDQPNDRPPA